MGAAVALAVGALAIGGAGCGSGGSSETSAAASDRAPALAAATKRVEAAKAEPRFTFDGPAFDPSAARGKSVFTIPVTSNIPFAVEIGQRFRDKAREFGIEVTDFPNQGTPNEWSRGIDQAISEHADAIVLNLGARPELLEPSLARARRAGIKIIDTHYYQYPNSAVREGVVDAEVYAPFNAAAELLADYAFVSTEGDLRLLVMTANDSKPSPGMVEAIRARLRELCGDDSCLADVVSIPQAKWSTDMKAAVQSALVKNPKINYVVPLYDVGLIGGAAGVLAAGRSGKVKMASFNGSPDAMKLIQTGDVAEMDIGESADWVAYATLDQTLRVLSGNDPIPDGDNNEKIALRIFDDSNIDETGTPPQIDRGYGEAYRDGYDEIWSGGR